MKKDSIEINKGNKIMNVSSKIQKDSKNQVSKLAKHVGKKTKPNQIRKIVPKRNLSSNLSIHRLVQNGDRDKIVKLLHKKPQLIDLPDDMGRTPLQIACLEGSLSMSTLLLQLGCDIDIRERQGWTALHFACACANEDALKIVQYLIKKGNTYVLSENNDGATPLHYLVVNNACEETALFLEVLTLMTSRGADVNAQNKRGETPLHQAALRGLEESVVMLINTQSVNLNLVDINGETCLHYAARGGHLNTVKILLSMGVDHKISGKNGTCLNVAEHAGHFEVIEFLREWESKHSNENEVKPLSKHLASITYNTKLLEAAEIMGIEPSVAIACLYQIQARGDPTDDLQILVAEANKYKVQNRECTVCLSNSVNSLFLPCRHSATCMECAQMVYKSKTSCCPICREEITDILQIFIS